MQGFGVKIELVFAFLFLFYDASFHRHSDLFGTLFFFFCALNVGGVGRGAWFGVQIGGVISRVEEYEGKAVVKHAWVSIRKMSA